MVSSVFSLVWFIRFRNKFVMQIIMSHNFPAGEAAKDDWARNQPSQWGLHSVSYSNPDKTGGLHRKDTQHKTCARWLHAMLVPSPDKIGVSHIT